MQWFIYSSVLQDLCIGLLFLFLPVGYAMLMKLNKAEAAIHGCQCLVGVWVCHLLQLFERSYLCCQMCANLHKKKQDDPPLRGSWKLNDPPFIKGLRTDDPPPLCSGPPPPPRPIVFDESLSSAKTRSAKPRVSIPVLLLWHILFLFLQGSFLCFANLSLVLGVPGKLLCQVLLNGEPTRFAFVGKFDNLLPAFKVLT